MALQPDSQIRLLSVPFEIDNKNQLTFSNITAQTNYFTSLPNLEVERASYQRKDNIINWPAHIDTLLNYNYVMYKNKNYSNKWFYAFIEKMEYNNDGLTNITIKQDVFQTWQFDLNYKKMFVEREHVNSDIIGEHTIPEGLETGELIIDDLIKFNMGANKYIIQCTEWINYQEGDPKPLATNYGGIFGAGGAYICDNINTLINILQAFTNNDSVFAVYMIPSIATNYSGQDMRFGQTDPVITDHQITKASSLDGYTPKNKKLLTFPYCFLNVSNNNGSSNTYQYELFKDDECNFKIKAVPTMGASIKCVPINYKVENSDGIEEEGLMAGKFPTLSWSADEYTNWLTQNAVNIGLGVASNLLTIVGGIASGNPIVGIAGITSGGMGIANTMGQIYEHSLTPNSARGNTNAGDINTCTNTNTFYFYKMSIKEEYARIIDDFFSAYGYKVNSYKIPNITGRTNWNYVKTIEANITANIPQQDLQEIKNIFNNGVTFWHNPNTFLDYSQNN